MKDATKAQIDLVLAALKERQARGAAPEPGGVTPEYLARLSREINAPVSASTWRRAETQALGKVRLSLLAFDALRFFRTIHRQ